MKKVILGLIVMATIFACNTGANTNVKTDSTKVDSSKVSTDTTKAVGAGGSNSGLQHPVNNLQ